MKRVSMQKLKAEIWESWRDGKKYSVKSRRYENRLKT